MAEYCLIATVMDFDDRKKVIRYQNMLPNSTLSELWESKSVSFHTDIMIAVRWKNQAVLLRVLEAAPDCAKYKVLGVYQDERIAIEAMTLLAGII